MPIRLTVALLLLAGCVAAQDKRLRTEYDKFQDQTTLKVETGLHLADYWSAHQIDLTAGILYPGRVPPADVKEVHLTFTAYSKVWCFLKESQRGVIFLVEGERIAVEDAAYEGKLSPRMIEFLTITLPLATVRKLAAASEVGVQLGGHVEGRLREKELAALRALCDALSANTSRPAAPSAKTCFENGRKVACP